MSDVSIRPLCATCASADRRLRSLDEAARQVLVLLIPNMCTEVRVCWECAAALQRLRRFRDAALRVQNLLAQTVDVTLIRATTALQISAISIEEILPQQDINDESIDNSFPAIDKLVSPIDNNIATDKSLSVVSCATTGDNLFSTPDNQFLVIDKSIITIDKQVKLETEINNTDTVCTENGEGIENDNDSLASIKIKLNLRSVKKIAGDARTEKVGKILKCKRQKISKDSYICKKCGKEFSTRGRFEYHKESHRDKPQCEECGRTFVSKSTLWLHRQLKHAEGERWTCGVCGKVQLTEAGHATHVAGHSRDARLFCAMCCKNFKTSSSFSKHMRSAAVHRQPDLDRYGCPDCERKFDTQERARQHHDVIHLRKNKFVCSQCPREYCTARALRVHERLKHEHVTLPRDKVCEICGKTFTTWQVLKAHRRTHTGARPYRCKVCTTTFTQSGALHTHMRRVHRNEHTKK